MAAFSAALEQASQRALSPTAQLASEQPDREQAAATGYETVEVAPSQPVPPTEATPSAELPVGALEPTVYPDSASPNGLDTPQSGAASETPQRGQFVAPTAAVVPFPLEPTMPVQRKVRRLPRISAALLIGLVVVIIAGGILGSLSLLAHFGVIGARSGPTLPTAVRGGTWIVESTHDPDSLIPNGGGGGPDYFMDQALYLPLFYGDPQGGVHPGATTEVPTLQNGGISPDVKTWTFHLRPNLVWSDGAPYDARDVDYTWRLWFNPKFGAAYNTFGLNLITSAVVSADSLSITFHLKQAYVPFLSLWVDGILAPLPAHHFSAMAPEQILKLPDNLNPQVVSGPFMMAERAPVDHYTLVRNPYYYRAREGLPYLDKVVFRINTNEDGPLTDLQAGTIDSTPFFSYSQLPAYQRLSDYRIVTPPTNANFEALYFNFHNTVLANHPEVHKGMAMAIDHQALINLAMHGFATPLCTDHGSFYHPGYEAPVDAPCPEFNPAAANKLLDDNGWVKGPDGVRTKGGQRLEFEFSTTTNVDWRQADEAILQRNFEAIGIKLDIQNYPLGTLIGIVAGGKASPPTGAVAGRYDIAEFGQDFGYDPDDSSLLSCGSNLDFYCNPALDNLYQQEQATVDLGVRQQLFDQIHHIYLTDFPFITLFSQTLIALVRKGTHNYQLGPFVGDSTVNIWQWWCDNGKC